MGESDVDGVGVRVCSMGMWQGRNERFKELETGLEKRGHAKAESSGVQDDKKNTEG